jgi:hypothetical protein
VNCDVLSYVTVQPCRWKLTCVTWYYVNYGRLTCTCILTFRRAMLLLSARLKGTEPCNLVRIYWRLGWKHYVPPTCCSTSPGLHDVTLQNTVLPVTTAVRSSNPKYSAWTSSEAVEIGIDCLSNVTVGSIYFDCLTSFHHLSPIQPAYLRKMQLHKIKTL